jgi:hypothetical protein
MSIIVLFWYGSVIVILLAWIFYLGDSQKKSEARLWSIIRDLRAELADCMDKNTKAIAKLCEAQDTHNHNMIVIRQREEQITRLEGVCAQLLAYDPGKRQPEEQFAELLERSVGAQAS